MRTPRAHQIQKETITRLLSFQYWMGKIRMQACFIQGVPVGDRWNSLNDFVLVPVKSEIKSVTVHFTIPQGGTSLNIRAINQYLKPYFFERWGGHRILLDRWVHDFAGI